MFKKNTIKLKNWNNCTSGELESRREAYLSNTVCIEVMESFASLKTSAKAAGLLKKKVTVDTIKAKFTTKMMIVKLHVCTVEQCTEIEKWLFQRGLCQALGSVPLIRNPND